MMETHEKSQDPRTGEIVTRIKVPEELKKRLLDNIQKNAEHANAFMQISRQLVQLQKKQHEEFEKACAAEMDIGKEVVAVREKMGLDSAWIYNLQLCMMERREPPPDSIPPEGVLNDVA
ncbi:MAG: hypothetical protein NUV91_09280 [Candidatus Omnitrophica bacterium]|nr:hypothetical protein [Candidatus Omnitrophota bacterium]